MFDFAWSELGLIAVVALIVIGPKDMPVAIKSVTGMIKKARRMASEFQTHVDEMVREADLGDVRDQIRDIRNLDLRGVLEKTVDEDGSIRRSLNDDPFAASAPAFASDAATGTGEVALAERPETVIAAPEPEPPPLPVFTASSGEIPAFVPPDVVPAVRAAQEAPAFVPPEVARQGAARPPGAWPHA